MKKTKQPQNILVSIVFLIALALVMGYLADLGKNYSKQKRETNSNVASEEPLGHSDLATLNDFKNWQVVDTGPFFVRLPNGWSYKQRQGIDSFVGEFVGPNIRIAFDYGWYGNSFDNLEMPEYSVQHIMINGYEAKLVSSINPESGITGIYFQDVLNDNEIMKTSLSMSSQNLSPEQQIIVQTIYRTVEFNN